MEPQGYVDTIDAVGRVIPLTIQTEKILETEHLAKNVRINLERDLPRFTKRLDFCVCKPGAIAIVSGGPSLRETINDLRDFDVVITCGSVHDFVVKQGIVPTYALVSDGGKDDKGNLSLPQKGTTYLIASQCDPNLFEHLKDFNVEMWHYRGQAAKTADEEEELLNGETSISWGSSVSINAISIALMLGYQHLHFFGFDNCYSDHGLTHHAYPVVGGVEYEKRPMEVKARDGEGKRLFITNLALLAQNDQFFRLLEVDGRFFHVTLHGDGLTAEVVRQGDPGLSQYVSLA